MPRSGWARLGDWLALAGLSLLPGHAEADHRSRGFNLNTAVNTGTFVRQMGGGKAAAVSAALAAGTGSARGTLAGLAVGHLIDQELAAGKAQSRPTYMAAGPPPGYQSGGTWDNFNKRWRTPQGLMPAAATPYYASAPPTYATVQQFYPPVQPTMGNPAYGHVLAPTYAPVPTAHVVYQSGPLMQQPTYVQHETPLYAQPFGGQHPVPSVGGRLPPAARVAVGPAVPAVPAPRPVSHERDCLMVAFRVSIEKRDRPLLTTKPVCYQPNHTASVMTKDILSQRSRIWGPPLGGCMRRDVDAIDPVRVHYNDFCMKERESLASFLRRSDYYATSRTRSITLDVVLNPARDYRVHIQLTPDNARALAVDHTAPYPIDDRALPP